MRENSDTTAAVVMVAGLAWTGGTYHWPGSSWAGQATIAVAHLVPVLLGVGAIAAIVSDRHPRRRRVLVTALACTVKCVTVAATVWAVTHPGGAGPHGFLDRVPIGLANAGGGLWLKSMIVGRPGPVGAPTGAPA